jgi:archaellum biogenesis protein FlaJ (TadC family)
MHKYDREKIRQDLYTRSRYCSVTNYEIDQVLELVEFWGVSYESAITRIASRMMQY